MIINIEECSGKFNYIRIGISEYLAQYNWRNSMKKNLWGKEYCFFCFFLFLFLRLFPFHKTLVPHHNFSKLISSFCFLILNPITSSTQFFFSSYSFYKILPAPSLLLQNPFFPITPFTKFLIPVTSSTQSFLPSHTLLHQSFLPCHFFYTIFPSESLLLHSFFFPSRSGLFPISID